MLTTITVVCAGYRLFISVCVWSFVRPGRAGWIKFLPLCFLPPLRNFVPLLLFLLSFFLFLTLSLFFCFFSRSPSLVLLPSPTILFSSAIFSPFARRFPVGEEWRIVDLVFLEDRFLSFEPFRSQLENIATNKLPILWLCLCAGNCVEIRFAGKFYVHGRGWFLYSVKARITRSNDVPFASFAIFNCCLRWIRFYEINFTAQRFSFLHWIWFFCFGLRCEIEEENLVCTSFTVV